jgi:uncharacterized membrane protein YkvA (DUF1232 family)
MKSADGSLIASRADDHLWPTGALPWSRPSSLHVVSAHDLRDLRAALASGKLPLDLHTKLGKLASESLAHRFVEQNCRLFLALLMAAQKGSFAEASPADLVRLLKVLAYVRRDEDMIPDYLPGGYTDDLREVRAATTELSDLLGSFKAWRLRHQVPALW